MRESSDEVIIMTDDGSYGHKGLVTEGVEEVIKRETVNKCFAIGPAIMMKFVSAFRQNLLDGRRIPDRQHKQNVFCLLQ